jgi:hypothetical protein
VVEIEERVVNVMIEETVNDLSRAVMIEDKETAPKLNASNHVKITKANNSRRHRMMLLNR